jgi:hypothetical protein
VRPKDEEKLVQRREGEEDENGAQRQQHRRPSGNRAASQPSSRLLQSAVEEPGSSAQQTGKMMQADTPPNQTIYINNLNEKVKKEGASHHISTRLLPRFFPTRLLLPSIFSLRAKQWVGVFLLSAFFFRICLFFHS